MQENLNGNGNMLKIKNKRNEKLAMAITVSHLTGIQICQLIDIDESTLYRTISNGSKLNIKPLRILCQILGKMPHEIGFEYE